MGFDRSAAGGDNRQSPGNSSRGDRCSGTVGVDKDTQAGHAKHRDQHVHMQGAMQGRTNEVC